MISQSQHSLHRFLNQRYLAILVLLIIVFSAIIVFMRYSAMDDTTDYYMHYDAQVLSEYYQVMDDIVEFDAGRKEYYWGVKRLPKRYQLLLDINDDQSNLALDESQLYKLADKIIYILPYYSIEKAEIFFVLHLFDLKGEAIFYQSWQNAFILLVTLFLLVVILYSLHTNRQITRQMTDFSLWIQSMSRLEYKDLQQQKTPESLSFTELVNSADFLQSSLLTQYELQHKQQALLTREKHFLSSLSHELRTPMAIMAAALTLLNNSDAITAKDKNKLVKLNKAHLTMKQLTNTLLQLWRGQQELTQQKQVPHALQNKVFLLDELVENSVLACKEHFSKRNICFAVNMQGNTSLFAQLELADILITNLLRNACQYSVLGKVSVDITDHTLLIENDILAVSSAENKTSDLEESGVSYGYGVGLFLAETICQQQQWQLNISSKAQRFTVEVIFHDAPYQLAQS
jgi:signal transduction histidine kinase